MTSYDAIIIGSGQAGNPLSTRLADHGWRVVLIEQADLGGTCVNTGCTPTKTMVASAQVAHYARHAEAWGVAAGEVRVDLSRVIARKDRVVGMHRARLERAVRDRPNLRLVRGTARFVGPHRVRVGDEQLEGDRIFVDVGARPAIPDLPGLDDVGYLTNATIMTLARPPEHLIVIGGGYIGLEFGQMFRRFGSRVTVIHRGGHVLPREDHDVTDELRAALEGEGIRFVLGAVPVAVERSAGDGVAVRLDRPEGSGEVRGSHLLVATGREPNTEQLGLEEAGIETDARGRIRVNGRLETSVPGVWALGDVTGGPAFTHIAYDDYRIVYANVVDGQSATTDGRPVPYAVFTDPQLGRIGMTEAEARAAGRRIKVGKLPMSRVARAVERDETAGLMKIVVDADTDQILGAAVLAAEGGELVQILEFVMLARAPYRLLKQAIYIHPTLAEGFWSLMEEVRPAD